LHNFIIQKYVEKRKEEYDYKKDGHQYITPRSLLAIIRLAQGLARLRFNDEVEQVDVDEALRLIEVSRSSINDEEKGDKTSYTARGDTISSIFLIIREMCNEKSDKTVKHADVERKILAKNYTASDLENCLKEYINLSVLYQSSDSSEITLL
jgi:DNA replication licensing factor MCM7